MMGGHMNTVIDITIRDRVPYISEGGGVITYNSDYVVKFDFDGEWSENVKTVYFAFEDGTYKAVVIDGTTCAVPAFDNSHKRVFVGVQAGDIRTTCPCCLKILDSIADYVGEAIPDPSEDVYQQIINLINAIPTPSWDTLENKPFTSIGSGLKVEDGALTATAQGGADITITDTAEVGEVLTVEEVDSEGKPTKWKTEKPTAEQKQADWEQTDTTDASYIKNKPTIPDVSGKIDIAQGVDKSGEYLAVGTDGNVTTVDAPDVSVGVSYNDGTGELVISGDGGEITTADIDPTLTIEGKAADAKAVGDALAGKQAAGDYLTEESDPTVPTWAKQSTKPTYTASEVGALPDTTVIPSVDGMLKFTAQSLTDSQKAQARTNIGAGTSSFSGSYNDLTNKPTIPDVPDWAMTDTKPTYTASEVGAVATAQGTANSGKYLGVGTDGNVTTTDISKDNVVTALGYTPAKETTEKWELVKTITVEESVTSIEITLDEPCSKVIIMGTQPSTETNAVGVSFLIRDSTTNNNISTPYLNAMIAAPTYKSSNYTYIWLDGDRMRCEFAALNSSGSALNTLVAYTCPDISVSCEAITGFSFYRGTGFATGIVWNIYGVKKEN
jgi:hypothetical protein